MPPTLTQVYSFQYQDTGVLLNSDFSGILPFVDITKVSGLDAAPIRLEQQDREGFDGGYVDAQYETTRTVVIEGFIYAITGQEESYLDTLKQNYAPQITSQPLYFFTQSGGQRVVFGKSQGLRYDWDQGRRNAVIPFQVTILCEDPRIYSSSLQTAIINPASLSVSGRGYNRSYPMSYGGSGSSPSASINNTGNRPTPGLLTIAGPGTNPRVTSDNEGKTLRVQISLAGGDVLVLDLAERTVTLNGSTNRRNLLTADSRWWLIQPGINSIRYAADDITSQLTVSFRPAYR